MITLNKVDTEIDWRAYMQQVEQYRNGERDYALIKGDTGVPSPPNSYTSIMRIET